MTTPKHTPGPWYFEDGPKNTISIYTEAFTENAFLAQVPEPAARFGGSWINTTANARLIAAAPELLEALKELCADKYLSSPINDERMAKSKAAIRKATGQE